MRASQKGSLPAFDLANLMLRLSHRIFSHSVVVLDRRLSRTRFPSTGQLVPARHTCMKGAMLAAFFCEWAVPFGPVPISIKPCRADCGMKKTRREHQRITGKASFSGDEWILGHCCFPTRSRLSARVHRIVIVFSIDTWTLASQTLSNLLHLPFRDLVSYRIYKVS